MAITDAVWPRGQTLVAIRARHLGRERLTAVYRSASSQLPSAYQLVPGKRQHVGKIHAEDMTNIEIGAAAFRIRIQRVLSTLVSSRTGIIQTRIGVDRLPIGVVRAEEQPILEPFAERENAGVVVRVETEQVIFDVAECRERSGGVGTGYLLLVQIEFSAEMASLRSDIARLGRDSLADLVFHSEIPALQVRGSGIDVKAIRSCNARSLGESSRKGIRERERIYVRRNRGEAL